MTARAGSVWVDVLAQAAQLFYDEMRAAGLEVKLGDARLKADAGQLSVQIDSERRALSLPESMRELVAGCQERKWQRFYPLPVDDADAVQYCSAIGPLRLIVTYDAGVGLIAAFDVMGREA